MNVSELLVELRKMEPTAEVWIMSEYDRSTISGLVECIFTDMQGDVVIADSEELRTKFEKDLDPARDN
jgi:hypothetical protein